MKTGIHFFKSRVAKRIFLLFLACAMLPIGIFSCLAFFQVSAQLKEQSITRLQNTAKSYGLILFERFSMLETELSLFGSPALHSDNESPEFPLSKPSSEHFDAVAFITSSNDVSPIVGEMGSLPHDLTEANSLDVFHTTKILFDASDANNFGVFIMKQVSATVGEPGLLVGKINTTYLWGIGHENILPPLTESSILDQTRNIIFSSFSLPDSVLHQIRFSSDNLESRTLEYTSDGEVFFLGYWPMFLQSKFEGSNLIVVLRTPREDVLAPLSDFKVLFPLVAILAFWIVLLLSTISIRKSLLPLEKLKAGAIRLARRDFDTRVDVKSGDEFEALADTFNRSAADLGRQFHAMEAMADIDRAVHASLSTRTIVNTALKRMYSFFSCDMIGFGLLESRREDTFRMLSCLEPTCEDLSEEFLTIAPEDRPLLSTESGHIIFGKNDPAPSFLPRDENQSISHFLVLPLYLNRVLKGIICLGHRDTHPYSEDDVAHAQRLANQISAALSNAHLLEELEILNWGTLEALARTVDAKSKWTAGHSERVAELSVKTARVLGCNEKIIFTLHQAAFLHDIGKVGIPLSILDKPGKLSDEEYEEVKQHPLLGAKILEPIESYTDVIPFILQHHERFDGKGYPHGLAGEEISLGGRILAVADVYDALVSKRPYRQGWVEEKVLDLIMKESGNHFDPKVVDAFLSAVSWSVDSLLNNSGPS